VSDHVTVLAPEHVTVFAPGRVNLIGEHTDYNDGLALPFAIGVGVTVVARALAARRIEAIAADLGERDEFALDGAAAVRRGWAAFVRGAVAELERSGVAVGGARLTISGDVPRGAGLGSSAALTVAVTMALLGLARVAAPPAVELARLCSRVENDWVGARTELLDQLASLCGERDAAVLIDFRSLAIDTTPMRLDGYRLAVLDSGERHENAASGYNERRAECARACELLGLDSLREATLEAVLRLPEPLDARATHVVRENVRVEAAVRALQTGDLPALGRLLNASHASLRDQYEVSTPAVEAAVSRLHEAGALGARVIGGGFGGHVLGLFGPDAPPPPGAIEVRPGPGAGQQAQ
jgi:galactokinase